MSSSGGVGSHSGSGGGGGLIGIRPSYVQGQASFSATFVSSLAATFPGEVVGGDLMVVDISWAGIDPSPVVTDTLGSSWRIAAQITDAVQNYSAATAWAIAPSTGANTVTATIPGGGSTFVRVLVHEYYGVDTLDVSTTASDESGSSSSMTIPISVAVEPELVHCWPLWENGTPSPGAGFTARQSVGGEISEDVVANAGMFNVTSSSSMTSQWLATVTSFYLSGFGGVSSLRGDETFHFVQGTPAATWNVAHNLGKYPSTLIRDSAGDNVECEVSYTDLNNLVITASAPFSGTCDCN